jgi:hypothetical protein
LLRPQKDFKLLGFLIHSKVGAGYLMSPLTVRRWPYEATLMVVRKKEEEEEEEK